MTTADVERVAERALVEAHGSSRMLELRDIGYPVPTFMTHADCVRVVSALVPTVAKL
jgi:hypothetical protein